MEREIELRCVECGGEARPAGGGFRCERCGAEYPVRAGTIRMLPRRLRDAEAESVVKRETGESFAYEWSRFGQTRPEWRANFIEYLRPHPPEALAGIRMLDVGTGSGRHSRVASELGAEVVAVDLGDSIDVARANLPDEVTTIQADAEALPFPPDSFDMVISIGVLHHLPDPERALRSLVPYVKPGGHLHVYLYWQPPRRAHRAILRMVTAARRVTTQMPHRLLHLLCYPLAALLWAFVVQPYRLLRATRFRRLADAFPLKAYADYPFGVLVNDQFDRFSAPIENRYTEAEVARMMRDAGLEDVVVIANHGWVADGRRPAAAQS